MPGYETFYREDPIEVRQTQLPADVYNLTRRLLAHSDSGCVFVPIRAIQYLAVLDAEEIIFVDREAKHLVQLAWRAFRPQARAALDEPVPYELNVYLKTAFEILPRLLGEFRKALQQIEERQPAVMDDETPRVVPFPGETPSNK